VNVRTTHTQDAPPDPREQAARRFPLIPRSKPPCPPLQVRLGQIRARAHATGDNADKPPLLRAAQALNLAALAASDTGLPDLARQLCLRQATIFLTARPFDAATAKLALQPLINIGRLLIRDGKGAAAYRLFEQLLTAAKTRTDTTIDGTPVPFTDLTRSAADHREITQWLWQVLLADGTRALAQAGRWPDALEHARQHKAIGQRLLDGRQIAVLAHSSAGQHETALAMLAASDTPEPWEETVAATLTVLCRLRAHQPTGPATTRMVDQYLAQDAADRGHAVFHTRLGLSVIDLLEHDPPARVHIADALVRHALDTKDAYAARDILTHPPCGEQAGAEAIQTLRDIVHAAALGQGALPPHLHRDLMKSVKHSETVLRQQLRS
jgi:hypothetical protein